MSEPNVKHGLRCARRAWHGAVATLLASYLALGGKLALAAGTFSIFLPSPPSPPVNGLAIALDGDSIDARGYRPLRVTVTCTPPPKSARTLEMRFSLASWGMDQRTITVDYDFEIPPGSSSVTRVVTLPHFSMMPHLSLEVREDNARIDEFTTKNSVMGGNNYYGRNESPVVLFVSASPPDVDQFRFAANRNAVFNINSPDEPASVDDLSQYATFASMPASALFDNWLNYSSFDVVFISLADIQTLAADRPTTWEALRKWARIGGNLCVHGVGEGWNHLAMLDQLLARPLPVDASGDPVRGWEQPPKELYGRQFERTEINAVGTPTSGDPESGAAKPPPETPPFLWTELAIGRVVAIADSNPFPGESANWIWMFNTLGVEHWRWSFRHGLALDGANSQFDNFLLADIGLPPIQAYRILITLFVIGIGPLNYWLLWRTKRLHLMLFTVPVTALVISAGLVAYAIIGDGLGTQVRARSYTELDQRNKSATSWARLSYYAGMAPSRGLLFDSQTAVYPLQRTIETWGRTRFMSWAPAQHLTSGWLVARMPTQYLTLRSYDTRRELGVVEDRDEKRISVENRLDTTAHWILLSDSEGKLHAAKDVSPGVRAALEPIEDSPEGERLLSDLHGALVEHAPKIPADMPSESNQRIFGVVVSRRMGQADASAEDSLLESALGRVMSEVFSRAMEPRTYVAVVDRPAEVEIGLNARETQSLHVIFGHW